MAQERRVAKNLELRDQPGESASYMELQDTGETLADHWRLQEDDAATDWQPVEYSRPPRTRPNWVLPSLIGVALVAVVSYMAWIGISRFGPRLAFWQTQDVPPGEVALDESGSNVPEGAVDAETAGEGATDSESTGDPSGEPADASAGVGAQAPDAPTAVPTPTPTIEAAPTPTVPLIEQEIATINNQYGVNARQEPTLDADVLRILEQGETVVVLDERPGEAIDGNWLQVQLSEGALAWISSDFVERSTQLVTPEPGTVAATSPPAEDPAPEDSDTTDADAPVADGPATPIQITINSPNGLNARTAPTPDAEIVATLADAASFAAIQRTADNQWVQIELLDGSTAWVFTDFVTADADLSTLPVASEQALADAPDAAPAEPETTAAPTPAESEQTIPEGTIAVVVSSTFGVNARIAPEPTANVLSVLPNNSEAIASGRTEDATWLQVLLDADRTGWINIDSIVPDANVLRLPVVASATVGEEPTPGDDDEAAAPTPDGATATVASLIGTNARNAPNTTEPPIRAVPSGTVLPVLGRSADSEWVQVELDDGTVAWVFTNNVELSVDVESLPVTE